MAKKLILDFLKKRKYSYILAIAFMFLTSSIQALFPKILGNTIDILKTDNFDSKLIKIRIGYIMLIAIGAFLTTYIWRTTIIGNGRHLECYLREKLYEHFQKLSPEFYSKRKTGDLIAYAINDISAVRMTFGPAITMSLNGVITCIISIYSMLNAVDLRLTLIALLPIPFIIFFIIKLGSIIQKRFRKVQESFASISDKVQENINGIRVIKSYVQEEYECENFEKLNSQMVDANINMVKISALLSPIIEISFSISFVMSLIIGGNMVLKGTISLGDFIAFNGYLTMIMRPIISIGRIINILQRGAASLKRLDEIFNTEPTIKDGEKMIQKPIEGNICFSNLSFNYPSSKETAIENINIDIPKGHTLGILGKTASGKTTIVNLLLKLYNVPNKKITIDGIDINDYSLQTLRAGIGYVPQDNFLFSASIKDNMKFFKDTFSDEDVFNAAKLSCIYDSIMDFPNEFNTILGERGVNLSGGQKQRISIGRSLIKNPSVLILDDSLSAVDTITEANILKNLKDIRKDKTTIIIAHRISALKDADSIIVLDKGKICERGTHNELINQGGLYYEIYQSQSK